MPMLGYELRDVDGHAWTVARGEALTPALVEVHGLIGKLWLCGEGVTRGGNHDGR